MKHVYFLLLEKKHFKKQNRTITFTSFWLKKDIFCQNRIVSRILWTESHRESWFYVQSERKKQTINPDNDVLKLWTEATDRDRKREMTCKAQINLKGLSVRGCNRDWLIPPLCCIWITVASLSSEQPNLFWHNVSITLHQTKRLSLVCIVPPSITHTHTHFYIRSVMRFTHWKAGWCVWDTIELLEASLWPKTT